MLVDSYDGKGRKCLKRSFAKFLDLKDMFEKETTVLKRKPSLAACTEEAYVISL